MSFAAQFAAEHKYTLIYGAIGYILGHFVDEMLTFTIPLVGQWKPTEKAVLFLGLAGAGYGFMKDQQVYWFQNMLKKEVQAALNKEANHAKR